RKKIRNAEVGNSIGAQPRAPPGIPPTRDPPDAPVPPEARILPEYRAFISPSRPRSPDPLVAVGGGRGKRSAISAVAFRKTGPPPRDPVASAWANSEYPVG